MYRLPAIALLLACLIVAPDVRAAEKCGQVQKEIQEINQKIDSAVKAVAACKLDPECTRKQRARIYTLDRELESKFKIFDKVCLKKKSKSNKKQKKKD